MVMDLQVLTDLFKTFMMIAFPIALVMLIAEKLISIFKQFVLGNEVRFK